MVATDGTGTTTRNGGKFLSSSPESYDYDDDGNLTSDGRLTYTWDAENRLTRMESHAAVPVIARRKLAFAYDAMGRRIRKTTWYGTSDGTWQLRQDIRFLHELGGWNILAEIFGDGKLLRTYTWGTDLSGNLSGAGGVGGLLFTKIHGDGSMHANGMDLNGNVSLLVSTSTGHATATYEYGPFGEPLRQSGEYASLNLFRFSTKYTDDETGLLDYGHRYYDPLTGRWPSRDPIGEVGGINLYGMVANDPVNRWDLLGMVTLQEAHDSFKKRGGGPRTPSPRWILTRQEIFDEWYRLEKAQGSWWSSLPKCPKKLCIQKINRGGTEKAFNTYAADPSQWNEPDRPTNAEENLHPGTTWSMRSKADGAGHANQCTYDTKGILLRTPPGSGTVDWYRSGTQTHHYNHDVAPVYLANSLDGGASMGVISSTLTGGPSILGTPGANLNKYFEVRPLWAESP